jgi:hypothetical protein
MGCEGVFCIDGEGGRGGGGGGGGWGGRLRSGSGTLLLGSSLFWKRLYLERHGGLVDVVVVVVGSSGGGGGGGRGIDVFVGIVGVVVVDALFVTGNFLV